MAKRTAKPKADIDFENELWTTANELHGAVAEKDIVSQCTKEDVALFCKTASLDEVRANHYVLSRWPIYSY